MTLCHLLRSPVGAIVRCVMSTDTHFGHEQHASCCDTRCQIDAGLDAPPSIVHPEGADAIDAELERQRATLEMIASEKPVPAAVQAQGSVLTNKYAEGYPGRRDHGGCEHADVIEQVAIDPAKTLFGAERASAQPLSGAQANAAAMHAPLTAGDAILGLDLAHGGTSRTSRRGTSRNSSSPAGLPLRACLTSPPFGRSLTLSART